MRNRQIKETIIAGFALFSMFFGAGNLIFPPELGLTSGKLWFAAFLGFFIMDAGLAVLGVFTMISYEGNMNRVNDKIGRVPGKLLSFLIVLCMGPLIAVPRTGSVTYSMGIRPLLGEYGDSPLPLLVFSVVFFAIVLVLSIKPGKVVNIIGNYMTPILLAFLVLLIAAGMILGKGAPTQTLLDSPVKEGIVNGYQTLDGMAALLFSGMLIKETLHDKNSTPEEGARKIKKASILAGILLFFIYGGLTYLGRVWGQPFAEAFQAGSLDQAGLLTGIVGRVLGNAGVYVIAVITFFACMTTAIGLTSSSAELFSEFVHGKISYKTFCIIICISSTILSNFGLEPILLIAGPILELVYPPIIVLLVLGIAHKRISGRLPYILGAGTAFAVSVLSTLCDTFGIGALSFIHVLPLDSSGLGFVLPAGIAILIGLVCNRKVFRRKTAC